MLIPFHENGMSEICRIFAARINLNHNSTMKTMQKKRMYVRPAMQVFELSAHARLLAGSGDGGLDPLTPYTPGGNDPLNP